MQPLSAPIGDVPNLPDLYNLECKYPTVYFQEKEMQNQRHEVCLKYVGLEYCSSKLIEGEGKS
jgi:hypothetical protein